MRIMPLLVAMLCCGCAVNRTTSTERVIDVTGDLASAVAHAQPGDTIRIPSGTYKLDKPLVLEAKGTQAAPIRLEAAPDAKARPVLDFSAEAEEKDQYGLHVKGDWWHVVGIDVRHAGNYGIFITGSHNTLERCVSTENRNTGTHLGPPASYNLIVNCESFRNFDPKTQGENADGFAAKHEVGPGNVFRACRSYQNADDGWDLWMCPNPIVVEDCVSYRNGYNIWHIPDFQGDGNGFKFGGNYVATPHICRRWRLDRKPAQRLRSEPQPRQHHRRRLPRDPLRQGFFVPRSAARRHAGHASAEHVLRLSERA